MITYTLTFVYANGEEQVVSLSKPHSLADKPAAAVVYEDEQGRVHNVPLSALRDFYFHPTNFSVCSESKSATLILPTPGCDCADCQKKVVKLKQAAANL